MKNRTLFLSLTAVGLAVCSIPLTGCSYLRAHAARAAYAEYQDAMAANDLPRARTALLKLVRTDQDVADYWIELGKLQIELADYRGAYDAFSHAHELDRSNVEVLAVLAQIALLSRDLDLASTQARSLSLVAPNNPVVTLVQGYVAYNSGELDKAMADAETLLATTPNDPFARILKAGVLVQKGRTDDAISVLEDQHRAVPQDRATVRSLVQIYAARRDWHNLARIQMDAHRVSPKDPRISSDLVEALLRDGNVATAAKVSAPLLSSAADPQVIDQILTLWSRFAPPHSILPNAMKLATSVDGERRLAFANYFNRIDDPRAAAALLGGRQLPVTHANAGWNAAVAQSLALQGQLADARKLFDLVLSREPDQVDALRGRSALEARTGAAKQAVIDAQRLVTITPKTGEDRLLLAQAYLAARNGTQVRRTLWDAFQELPDDERVSSALRSVLASTGDKEGVQRLDDEVSDRRSQKLTKELI
ncbi:MAG TPA: tetratricopeptide repeat protein [Sphingomicrobium sp.]|nr:tetratricopeptide repeat protein [Sphingomicrobium sp.]